MTIAPLPPAPNRTDPATFSDRADALVGALPGFVTQANALQTDVNAKQTQTALDTATASAAAASAVAAAGATEWVPNTSYTVGSVVFSPVDFQTYRSKTAHSGLTADPSTDTTNWVKISVSNIENNALLNVIQTFTANQIVSANFEVSGTTTLGGATEVSDEFKATSYNETVVALTGTTPAVNCETGNVFTLTTSGNTTFTFSNPPASGTAYGFTLRLTAGGTHTITYPASVDFAGGTAPDAPANGETDVLVFFTTDGGTTFFGFQAGDALS